MKNPVASMPKNCRILLYTNDKNCAKHTLCSINLHPTLYKIAKIMYNAIMLRNGWSVLVCKKKDVLFSVSIKNGNRRKHWLFRRKPLSI